MRFLLAIVLLLAQAAQAHEVRHEVTAASAAVVSLSYVDGSPFAYEKYELYAEGKDRPQQVGNTDSEGHVVFVPGEVKHWRLRAFSADGHGVDLRFELAAAATTQISTAAPAREGRLALGLALILGAFGAYHLYLKKRNKK